jgi:hypothetical protein
MTVLYVVGLFSVTMPTLKINAYFCSSIMEFFNLQRKNKQLEIAVGIYTYIQMISKQNAMFVFFVFITPTCAAGASRHRHKDWTNLVPCLWIADVC